MKHHEAVREVADHIRDHLKPGLDATTIAASLIDAEDAIEGETISLEVPGRYTVTGNPFLTMTEKPEDG